MKTTTEQREKMKQLLAEFAELSLEITTTWEQCDDQTQDDLCEEYPFEKSFDDVAYNIRTWSQTFKEM